MSKIRIVAESGADIPAQTAKELGIIVVPMHVQFGEVTKDDGTFAPEDVITYYNTTRDIPKTSGANMIDFENVFDRIHEEDKDAQILYLAYSAVTTCSYSCAMNAAAGRDYVTAIDTKMVSFGECQIVVKVAKAINEHPEWTIKEAAEYAEKTIAKAKMSFLPDTLTFLAAGGRVKNHAMILANVLHLHPVIETIDGHLIAGKKYRGSMKRIYKSFLEDFTDSQVDTEECWCGHCPSFSETLKNDITEKLKTLGYKNIHWVECGGVISTHGGPGAWGIAAFLK